MNGGYVLGKTLSITLVLIFLCSVISPSLAIQSSQLRVKPNMVVCQGYALPPPEAIDVPVEEALMKRMSVREFTDEPVSDQDLATILWSAFGKRPDGGFTIPSYDGSYACVLYVLKEDAVYTYDPDDHTLVLYKEGDYRDVVGWQWEAPIQLGLCWNTDVADSHLGSAQLGAVGQNIYFSAIALGLGTVITAQTPEPAIKPVGLPANHQGMGVMPLGHPEYDYHFVYQPRLFSFLPRVQFSDMSVTTAFNNREQVTSWDAEGISRGDLSHLVWSSYGYSYFLDESEGSNVIKRHHTVPSAHGYYPFRIYTVTQSRVSQYVYGLYSIDKYGLPVLSFLWPVSLGDKRMELGQISADFVADAPLSIIVVLDVEATNAWDDLSDDSLRWIWYYEAGAAAHNVLLQATSQGLAGNIVHITDKDAVCSLLNLDADTFDPMFIVPVG